MLQTAVPAAELDKGLCKCSDPNATNRMPVTCTITLAALLMMSADVMQVL
jgi:hypothetical protein